jgi:hypothetical protein
MACDEKQQQQVFAIILDHVTLAMSARATISTFLYLLELSQSERVVLYYFRFSHVCQCESYGRNNALEGLSKERSTQGKVTLKQLILGD